jgi:hypothetical protein
MAFYNKIKWVLGILMVFVLIIATNLIDRNNFITVRDSVETIYKDRLIANDLIVEMIKLVQEKEVAVALSDKTFFNKKNASVNEDIQNLVERFEETKLILEEGQVFENLKDNFEELQKAETSFVSSGLGENNDLSNHIAEMKSNLYDLAKIQLNEGRRQISISRKAIDTVELFTQMEIYLLVFLAIIIQVIVMYNPKEKKAKL